MSYQENLVRIEKAKEAIAQMSDTNPMKSGLIESLRGLIKMNERFNPNILEREK